MFLNIATSWPALMKLWGEKEKSFLQYPYRKHGLKLSSKIRITAVVAIWLTFLNQILVKTNDGYNHYHKVKNCNWTVDAMLINFLEYRNAHFFLGFSFNFLLGIFIEIMNFFLFFGWAIMELFLMIVSLGLETRFQQINDRLDALKGKVLGAFLKPDR